MANVFSRLALDVHCSDFTLSVLYQTNPFCVYCIVLYMSANDDDDDDDQHVLLDSNRRLQHRAIRQHVPGSLRQQRSGRHQSSCSSAYTHDEFNSNVQCNSGLLYYYSEILEFESFL